MGKIVNKRNAVLGWFTWRIGKRIARRKARSAVPAVEGGRPNKPAIATGIAALGGALLFWRRRRRRATAGGDTAGDS
jgi:LPXTG-motif cell wall-anchored protein